MHSLLTAAIAWAGSWEWPPRWHWHRCNLQGHKPAEPSRSGKVCLPPRLHSGALYCVPRAAWPWRAMWEAKDYHNGTEGSYLKAVAWGAKKSRVASVEDSFVVLFKFHRMHGRIAVLRAARPSYFHVYNCARNWAYIEVNDNNWCNEVMSAPPSTLL